MSAGKIVSGVRVKSLGRTLKRNKKKIVFTNGTFDLLHLGHVDYLQKAKKQGDVLVVGVNSDKSVKSYKDPSRPVNPEKDRLRLISALECVDYAVLFSDPTPLKLINNLHPDVLVKGADWKVSQIAGAKEVLSWGGSVKRIKLVKGKSTTSLIKKIKKLT